MVFQCVFSLLDRKNSKRIFSSFKSLLLFFPGTCGDGQAAGRVFEVRHLMLEPLEAPCCPFRQAASSSSGSGP